MFLYYFSFLLHNCDVIVNKKARKFFLLQKYRSAVGPTQSHSLWVPRVLFTWVIGRRLKLITRLRLVLRLRMSRATLPLSQYTFTDCTSYLKMLWKPNATHEVAWVVQIFRCSEDTCFADSAKMIIVFAANSQAKRALVTLDLTLIVLMWRIGWAHNNARK